MFSYDAETSYVPRHRYTVEPEKYLANYAT